MTAKAPRKPSVPRGPRGLTLTLGIPVSDKLRELASMGGLTKDALEDRLSAWVEANLGAFRTELANAARSKVSALIAEEKSEAAP